MEKDKIVGKQIVLVHIRTTSPIAITIARRVRMLIDMPKACMIAIAPIRENGIVISGMRVARKLRKNMYTIISTSIIASNIE